jgi:hypothetical protein
MHALKRAALVAFALSTLPALTVAPAAFAHKGGYSYGTDDDFSWAFVSNHGRNISGNLNSDNIGKLKDRYDGEFLYIRDGEERWVITDPDLIDRAHRVEEQIKNYNKEISEIANAEAKFAMAGMNNDKKQAKLSQRRRALEDEIDKLKERGEDTSDLDRELFEVKIESEALTNMHKNAQLTSEERRDLTERRDRASARLKKGMQKIEGDLRKVLSDAKEQHLAERVDLED